MPESPEFELISRFRAGDASVFNLITKRWYEKILGFLYRVLGNLDDAQDACQRTFINVYMRLHQLKEPEKFSSWLYRIANNNAMDILQTRKNHVRFNNDGDHQDVCGQLEIPEQESVEMESAIDTIGLRGLFERIMLDIPDEQRVVIVMKLYQDMKFTEISETLDVPINTVKSRLYSGLRAMKEKLSKNKMIEEILRNEM